MRSRNSAAAINPKNCASGHNPPAAFVRPTLRKKLGLTPTH
jgi:hypothetical protein